MLIRGVSVKMLYIQLSQDKTGKRSHVCILIASGNLTDVMQSLDCTNKLTKSPFIFCFCRSNLLRISAFFIKIKEKTAQFQ